MPFEKGKPRTGGRRKGTPNRSTAGVKAALEEAFDLAGGVPALVEFAKTNPASFYALWGKLIPSEVKAIVTTPTKPRVSRIVIEHHVAKDPDPPKGESPADPDGGGRPETGVPSGPGEGLGIDGEVHIGLGGYAVG